MRVRRVAVVLLAAIAASAVGLGLVGCGTRDPILTFWIGGAPKEIDYWETVIHEFQNATGYRVRMVRQPTDSDQRRQELVISLESGQRDPDVFLMDVVWIGQFACSQWLQPLDHFVTETGYSLDVFFPGIIDDVDRYQEGLMALPIYVDGGLLYYRKDLLRQYGYDAPPETWAEMVTWAQRIQQEQRKSEPSFYGFVWQGAQYEGLVCTFLEFAASNGGGIMREGKIFVDRPENLEALKFMRNLVHRYRVSPPSVYTEMKEEEVRSVFQRGGALFQRNWPYAWNLHQSEASAVRGKVGIAPLPSFKEGERASTLGGWHVGMSQFSDSKDRAWALIKFITSREIQKKLVLNLGWNPGRKDLYSDRAVLERLPHLANLRRVFEHAVARPNIPYYTQVSDVIQRYANRCLAGRISAADALERMQREIDQITAIYGGS